MAKKDRNAPNADTSTDATSNDQPAADATDAASAPIPMDDFMSRADRADWISVKDAATLIGGDMDAQKMRNASNNRAEFRAAGTKLLVAVPGYDIRPLTYLHRAAVEAYQANNASGNTRAARISANGKRWIIRVKDQDQSAVIDALAAFGITLEVASTPKRKKSQAAATDASQPVSSDQPLDGAGNATEAATDTAPLGNGDGDAPALDPRVDQFGQPVEWKHAES
jgi:hypothetical protein